MRVLVISPHPDDETLACGGTILKHKDEGDEIYWLIITNVDIKNGWDKNIVEERQKEIETVAGMYGFEKIFKLDYPTAKLDTLSIQEIIKSVSEVILGIKPEIIYLPNRSDVHTDHQITFKAAYSCTKNFRYPFIRKILMYETLSETEFAPALPGSIFIPNFFVDITNYFEKKLEIFKIYKSEVMNYPLPRSLNSIKALARYRGSQIGVEYAEGFMLVREISI
jgi:LmbE family N-acetylglucosaminyl deacetylase